MIEGAERFKMLDTGGYKKEQIQAGDKTVVCFMGEDGKVSTIPDHNIFILDPEGNVVWDMSMVFKGPDAAVNMRVEDGKLYFNIFYGYRFCIDLETLETLEKLFTK